MDAFANLTPKQRQLVALRYPSCTTRGQREALALSVGVVLSPDRLYTDACLEPAPVMMPSGPVIRLGNR